jgi:hypothetical protein
MPRLIDANALLDAYDAAHKGPPGGARELIANAPTANGWISVKDRMPEQCDDYLINTKTFVTVGWYNGDNEWIATDGSCYGDGYVTHWQEMPEPPKEE